MVSARISRLRALIDHPGTGANERAAAQRALHRMLSRTVPPDVPDDRRPHSAPPTPRGPGDRYHRVGRHAGVERIADLVRADIALARALRTTMDDGAVAVADPLADAPATIRITVSTPDSMSIVVDIDDVPGDWTGLEALAADIAAVVDGYNHSGSAPRFFARVRAGGRTLIWSQLE